MTHHFDRALVIAALRQTLPYIRLYKGKVFVVKIGGATCSPAILSDLCEQLRVLCETGIRVVLVHGGGPQTTLIADKLGAQNQMIEGRRVTDEKTLEAAIMAINGSVSTAILSACRAVDMPAIGLSGVDAGLVRAVRRPPQQREIDGAQTQIDFGLVGDITSIDGSVLRRLLDGGFVPVVSPLAADDNGQVLNINADSVASAIARELSAEKLIFLTDTQGLLEDKDNLASLVSYTDVNGLEALKNKGAISAGMLPKVKATMEALLGGVKRVHIVGHATKSSVLIEVFTNEGAGTLIVRDRSELLPAEQSAAAHVTSA